MSNDIEFLATKVFKEIREATLSNKYKLIIEEGSSRSSKTWSNFQVLFLDLFENPLTTCTILRDTQKSCREIVEVDWIKWLSDPMGRKKELEESKINIKEFDELIKKESLLRYFKRNKTNHTWTFIHNDSFIRFTGLDDEDDAMGMTQDICWINEPYRFSHEVYKQLSQRTSKYILFDWNPKQSHWVSEEKKKDNTIVLYSTFQDNPFCPPESKKQIESYQPLEQSDIVLNKLLTDKECYTYDFEANVKEFTKKQINEVKRCIYNESVNSSSLYHWLVFGRGLKSEKVGRIYNWQEINYFDYLAINKPTYYGCDWGLVDPWGIVEVKYHDGNLYVHELNYKSENQIRAELTQTQLHQVNASQDEGLVSWTFERLNIAKDKTIVCDSNRPSKIVALRRAGWEYAVSVGGKSKLIDRIGTMQSLNVYYTHTSINLKYEQENYCYQKDKFGATLEQPEDGNDHLINATEYITEKLFSLQIIKNI